LNNIINKTIYDGNYTFKINDTWNVTNLLKHIENSLYTENSNAPSFLSRFEYDLSPSPYGIESMVNLKKFQGLGINEDSSIIDYHYFPDDGNGDYRINVTPSWVKIDDEHRIRYNATGVSYIP